MKIQKLTKNEMSFNQKRTDKKIANIDKIGKTIEQ